MANKTYYERGDTFVDISNKPAIIKRGNELTFTDNFKVGGGVVLAPATAETLGGVKVGNGLNVASDGTLSIAGGVYSTDEVDTGKKWIDGKPIFTRVINYTGALSNTAVTLASNIDYIDNITNAVCVADNVSEGFSPIVVWLDNIELKGRTAGNYASQLLHIVIEYTKPTPAETSNNRTIKKSTSKKG